MQWAIFTPLQVSGNGMKRESGLNPEQFPLL
jgi:hypothetical protein